MAASRLQHNNHNPGGGRFGRIVGGERGGVGRLGRPFYSLLN